MVTIMFVKQTVLGPDYRSFVVTGKTLGNTANGQTHTDDCVDYYFVFKFDWSMRITIP